MGQISSKNLKEYLKIRGELLSHLSIYSIGVGWLYPISNLHLLRTYKMSSKVWLWRLLKSSCHKKWVPLG